MTFFGLVAAGATFGVISLSALLVAPRKFLLNDPHGMKVMTRAGVKSPIAPRIVAVVLVLISCGVIALALTLLLERPGNPAG